MSAVELISKYYQYFNEQNIPAFLELLDDDVCHDINQGGCEYGKDKFAKFMIHMNRCYAEKANDIKIMVNSEGTHVAAKFYIDGKYLQTDGNLPLAREQPYRLLVGAFFEISNNKITRVTNYYNMQDWLKQVRNHD